MNRFEQQMKFILEIDKVKNVFRQTYLADGNRKENDAEHSWHMAIMAFLLKEYAQEEVDIMRVVLMVLIHDLVEIDAGDTYAYDLDGLQTKREREVKAVERIFGLLPKDQEEQFRELWDEFEAYESAEAKYAHMLDNFQPLMLNDALDGKSWKEHKVKKSQIYSRNAKTMEGSEKIWEYMKDLVQKNIDRGNIQDE
ncbi:5'-nucleotidase [Blautia hydrogenotrophica]|uniref:HD domain-containing protein n=1 Tax=Blautia hydrogenotrophica TaxID=53443 RepID=UPI0006C1914D|nr:HD domain-containing protein [Blautia hydrogenotrophica]CUN02810.1 5'-nucleotidase [Blautia hydrogenotrophica]SCH97656.1 5'-nucleotidase [uncultured Blautia sp.]